MDGWMDGWTDGWMDGWMMDDAHIEDESVVFLNFANVNSKI